MPRFPRTSWTPWLPPLLPGRETSPQRGAETEFPPARARSSAPEHICDGLVRAELPNSAGAGLLYANWLFFAGNRRTDVKARRISSSSISRDRSSARAQCRRWTAVRISRAGRAGQRLVLEPRGRSGWSCARHHSRRGLNRRIKIQHQDLETRPQSISSIGLIAKPIGPHS